MTLFITEHPELEPRQGGSAQAVTGVSLASQVITVGVVSTQSEAFSSGTSLVLLHSDAPCSIVFGANPVATTLNMRLAAGETRVYRVTPGHRVAVIQNV